MTILFTLSLIAIMIVVISIAIKTKIKNIQEKYNSQLNEINSKHSTEMQNLKDDMDEKKARFELDRKEFFELVEKQKECAPEMATMIADYLTIHYEKSADYLARKKHPAYVEAYRIRDLKQETAEYIKRMKLAEYELDYYKKHNKITKSETINLLLEDTEITNETSNYINEEKKLSPATNRTHQTSIFDMENANISKT